jgi:tRNA threonylcarbamoyladenosine biosynthesis protein TsaE
MIYSVKSFSAQETHEWGTRLGKILKGGDVICLKGELGAGKTAFAQGVGEALDITEPMTSPTFTFMQEYSARISGEFVRLIHMDLYRLRYPEEVEVIGVEDTFQPDTICLIEWPEIAEDYLPDNFLEISIKGSGEEVRTIVFTTTSTLWKERLEVIIAQ